MLPKNKSISPLSMSNSYYEKLKRQRALCNLLKRTVTSEVDSKEQTQAIDGVVLMLDQEPLSDLIKKKLVINHGSHHLKFYDKAMKVTERDIKKNIAKFTNKYNFNSLETINDDPVELNKLESSFIRWVVMILRCDCQDEYFKTDEGKEAKRKKNGTKKRNMAYKNSVIQKVSLNSFIRDNRKSIIGTPEQNLYSNIQGKFIGEIGKDTHSLNGIESLIAQEQSKQKSKGIQLKEYIEQDPENILKNEYPGNKNDCNCQVLLQLFLLENLTMNEVYEKLKCKGCKESTIGNYLANHKTEGSVKRKNCLKLIKQIANDKFNL